MPQFRLIVSFVFLLIVSLPLLSAESDWVYPEVGYESQFFFNGVHLARHSSYRISANKSIEQLVPSTYITGTNQYDFLSQSITRVDENGFDFTLNKRATNLRNGNSSESSTVIYGYTKQVKLCADPRYPTPIYKDLVGGGDRNLRQAEFLFRFIYIRKST